MLLMWLRAYLCGQEGRGIGLLVYSVLVGDRLPAQQGQGGCLGGLLRRQVTLGLQHVPHANPGTAVLRVYGPQLLGSWAALFRLIKLRHFLKIILISRSSKNT